MSVLPLALLAVVGVRAERRGLETAEGELEIAALDETTSEIDRAFESTQRTTHAAAAALSDPRIGDEDARIGLARDVLSRADDLVRAIAICTSDGAFVDAVLKVGETPPPGPCSLSEDAAGASKDEGFEGGFFRAATGMVYVEPLARAGERVGFLTVLLPWEPLTARVARLSVSRFGAPDRIGVLADPETLLFGAWPSGEHAIASRLGFDRAAFSKDLGATREVDSSSGKALVATLRTLPARHWAVVVARPEAEAFGALFDVEKAFALGVLVVGIAAGFVGVRLARKTTQPVKDLATLTRAYARREFGAKSGIATGDELELLGDAMEIMARDIEAGEREIEKKTRIEADFSRYLPAEVAKRVALGDEAIALGGERRTVTALFADVVSFTPFAEAAPPDRVVAFLNELFGVLSEVVFRHQGMVDKFMGDCVMALFGASGIEGHEASAVAAAEDMHRFVETSAADWKARFGIDVKLGIGIATGDALVGNLGSEKRMEYTAIGDAVNVASRLETLARPGQTLVTSAIAEAAGPEGFSFRSLGKHGVRGKKDELELFELSE